MPHTHQANSQPNPPALRRSVAPIHRVEASVVPTQWHFPRLDYSAFVPTREGGAPFSPLRPLLGGVSEGRGGWGRGRGRG